MSTYEKIINDNLIELFRNPNIDMTSALPAGLEGDGYMFTAFGETCRITPDGILLAGEKQTGPLGIVISLYALNANPVEMISQPFRAFKEFSNTTPYHGAFASHTERILVPHVAQIKKKLDVIVEKLGGTDAPEDVGGDFSMVVRSFPKISLCYIFYEADEDFPASVTCLFSNNANDFMPNDGLADTGEYTSKKILSIVSGTIR